MADGTQRVVTKERVLEIFDDRFLRWQVTPRDWRQAWVTRRGVVILRLRENRPQLICLGEPSEVVRLMRSALTELPAATGGRAGGPVRLTVEARVAEALPADLRPDPLRADQWEWMWADSAPPATEEESSVGWVDADERLLELLAGANPRHHGRPGDLDIRAWAGVLDSSGDLLAAGALAGLDTGVPHLRSITTAPPVRGQGWGSAVSSFLTRAALADGSPVVTLGLYSVNDRARRLYTRLGYRWSHTLLSGAMARSTTASVPSAK